MEKIVWIETPKCSKCTPDASFRRRRSCIGCDKLIVRPEKTGRKRRMAAAAPKMPRDVRNQAVTRLRLQGLSYGRIAEMLELPRSTVQSILTRFQDNSSYCKTG